MKEDKFYSKIAELKQSMINVRKFIQDDYPEFATPLKQIEGFLSYIESHGRNFIAIKEK